MSVFHAIPRGFTYLSPEQSAEKKGKTFYGGVVTTGWAFPTDGAFYGPEGCGTASFTL